MKFSGCIPHRLKKSSKYFFFGLLRITISAESVDCFGQKFFFVIFSPKPKSAPKINKIGVGRFLLCLPYAKGLPKFMLNDTQKGVIYQLVPTYWKDGEMFLKCRLKHVKCDFHGTVFPKINPYKSKLSGGLKISEITAIFGNRYNSELYNVSNYRGFEVSEHAKLCYNYLYKCMDQSINTF